MLLLSVACTAALLPAAASAQTITTFAGDGSGTSSGDGGLATSAGVPVAGAVAAAPDGSTYIGTAGSVRKVAADGIISTVAGTGASGYSGDGGAATAAQVGYVSDLLVLPDGDLILVDSFSYRVRRVDAATGQIDTIAGNGSMSGGGDGGPATDAQLALPHGIARDLAGNLYISERIGCRIRKIDGAGTITTFAGTGSCSSGPDGQPATGTGLNSPTGIRFDKDGALLVTEELGNRVRRIDMGTGIVGTLAGTGAAGSSGDNGPANAATLNRPYALAVDAAGNRYVAEVDGMRVRRIDANGVITPFAGNGNAGTWGDGGPATDAGLGQPQGLAIAPGRVFIAQGFESKVRAVLADVAPLVPDVAPPEPEATCVSEGYTGTKLNWCKIICENESSATTIDTYLRRWISRYHDLPYCAREEEAAPDDDFPQA